MLTFEYISIEQKQIICYLTQHRHGVHCGDEAGEHQGLGQGEVEVLGLGDVLGGKVKPLARVIMSNHDLGFNLY